MGGGSGTGKRPKCEKNVLGFLYMIKDHLIGPETNFQQDRLKTVKLVPRTKRRTDRRQIFNRKWIWDHERPKCEKK